MRRYYAKNIPWKKKKLNIKLKEGVVLKKKNGKLTPQVPLVRTRMEHKRQPVGL
jgi:hypothetical protein